MPEVKPYFPRLRFPEFRDNGPWKVKRLDALVNTITPPKKIQTSGYLLSGNFPIFDQSINEVSGWTDDKTAVVEAAFPLVVFGDHSCVVKLAKGSFAQGADGIKILAPKKKIEARFLYMYLQANPIEQRDYRRHFSLLKEKEILFPKRKTGEQEKVADFLTVLDDLIKTREDQVALLKDHKQGLMRRLFPPPGENVPHLRFPEFRDNSPWKVKRLEEVARIIKGRQLNKLDIVEGEYPVWNGGINPSGFHNEWNTEGDTITISEGGSCGFVNLPKTRFWLGGNCYALHELPNDIDREFLFRALKSRGTEIMRLRAGSGLPHIYLADLEHFSVTLPSLPEQHKVAECLIALDDLIEAQEDRVSVLRDHKRGLMQGLFPRKVS